MDNFTSATLGHVLVISAIGVRRKRSNIYRSSFWEENLSNFRVSRQTITQNPAWSIRSNSPSTLAVVPANWFHVFLGNEQGLGGLFELIAELLLHYFMVSWAHVSPRHRIDRQSSYQNGNCLSKYENRKLQFHFIGIFASWNSSSSWKITVQRNGIRCLSLGS